jgi:fermentation-respiration switch protein FrsA (DUF1100 family)
VWLTTSDGVRLEGWYCSCRKPIARSNSERLVVLLCHGNGGTLRDREYISQLFEEMLGWDVFLFDYRGYGRSEGTPTEAGLYRDSRAAWTYLTAERKIPPERILIYGESLGTAVALELANAVQSHRALVLQSAFTSIPDVAQAAYPLLPVRALARNRFDSLSRIGKHSRPLFCIHGDLDPIVPYEQGRRLYEAGKEPKHFLTQRGRMHDDACDAGAIVKLAKFLGER